MKLKKLIRKLEDYLDADSRERKEHRDEMKTLLQKMKVKEKNLAANSHPDVSFSCTRKLSLLRSG